ncbi:hypothetical protein GXW78_13545 [Roseomonas terrae]|uniref:Uncharacterized protein n=2 Tax=Neoroseomonas terrae TaxID=424799 RepID=A0ABS5EI44_9PROT|nr:hypothetical protein [Neoroseomonas terrae]
MLRALRQTANEAVAHGPDATAAAVRDRLVGLWPSLPLTMADEAAAFVATEAHAGTTPPPDEPTALSGHLSDETPRVGSGEQSATAPGPTAAPSSPVHGAKAEPANAGAGV